MTMPENPITGRETPVPSVSAVPKNIAEQLDLLVACAKPASGQNSAYVAVGIVRDHIAAVEARMRELEQERNGAESIVSSERHRADKAEAVRQIVAWLRTDPRFNSGEIEYAAKLLERGDWKAPSAAPVYPAAGWMQKPVGRDEVPRLVADIASRSRDGEPVATRDLFNRAIDVLCRVEDARREAVDATS